MIYGARALYMAGTLMLHAAQSHRHFPAFSLDGFNARWLPTGISPLRRLYRIATRRPHAAARALPATAEHDTISRALIYWRADATLMMGCRYRLGLLTPAPACAEYCRCFSYRVRQLRGPGASYYIAALALGITFRAIRRSSAILYALF